MKYKPRRYFTDKEVHLVIESYERGMPMTELATQYGCWPSTISRLLRRSGRSSRGRGQGRLPAMLWRQGEQVAALYATGLSVEEIERETKICAESLKKILAALGITYDRRPRSRERHPKWAGGRYVNDRGYVELIDDDPRFASMRGSDGYTPEHRLVMARALGRPLKRHESVHHVDGNRQNNALANLELRQGKHGNGVRFVCRDCGSHNVEAVTLTAKES